MNTSMKSLATLAALLFAIGSTAVPASARDSFVIDNAHLLSAATISAINAKVADFNATTHKEVFVDTEPTVDGTPQAAAEKIFAQQQVNGVLIYVAKSPKTIGVVPDRAASQYFPATSTSAIRQAIANGFNANNFDGGITNGVDLTLSMYRSHLGALTRQKASYAPVGSGENVRSSQAGFNLSWIWILIVLAVIFFIIRGIFRAMAGPRVMPPGYGGGPMGGGPMMGGGYGPGYGGGYGGGGGGSFWSGLMGGLGGAFLGNELFGGRRDDFGGNQAGFVDGGQQSQQVADTSGFQNDPGQADMGNASFGGWGGGDSGGGTDWGGGGGGGDFGGGGGDNSGGGW